MMKRMIATCAVVAALGTALAGQMPKYGVTANAEKNVDFSKFKTYSWVKGQPSAIKTIDAQVTAAVEHELSALGMTKAASGPGDVLVSYNSLTRTDVNVKAKADSSGARPQYSVGTLTVSILEPTNRRRLLELRVDRPIESATDQLESTINDAVAQMFTKYPTRAK